MSRAIAVPPSEIEARTDAAVTDWQRRMDARAFLQQIFRHPGVFVQLDSREWDELIDLALDYRTKPRSTLTPAIERAALSR